MLRNENGRVTCTTELSVDLDEKMENNESHDMDQRSSSRRLCSRSRSCSRSKQLQWEQSLVSFDWIKGFR